MRYAFALLAELRRDARGTSMLELGLALPLLMGVLVCLLDVSRMYSAQIKIQQAAARSLERVQVSRTRPAVNDIRDDAAAAAGVATSQVTVTSWTECNNNTARLPDTAACPDPPAATPPVPRSTARYYEVTVNSSYSPYYSFTPVGTRQSNGTVAISARSAVRVQ